jgi:quinohemoprotein ethanol dehydrogenase
MTASQIAPSPERTKVFRIASFGAVLISVRRFVQTIDIAAFGLFRDSAICGWYASCGERCAMNDLANKGKAAVASARATGAAVSLKTFAGAVMLLAAGYLIEAAQSVAATTSTRGGVESRPIGAAENWPAHNADAEETAYSRLDQISTTNVGRLGLAWSMDLPEISLEGTPLAVDGVLYFTGGQAAVYAVEGVSGKLLWKYDPESWKFYPQKIGFALGANRGVAYGDGRIYVGLRDGRLVALDRNTGTVIWSTETVAADTPQVISGAPRFFNHEVIMGNSGAETGIRCAVSVFDAATGKLAWRFYTTPGTPEETRGDPTMEKAAATWDAEYWKKGTGGVVWDGITLDADLNRIYIGTSNSATIFSGIREPHGGDTLFTASVVALDADTGKYVWHYQETPRDIWDFDSAMQMTLADLVIDGKKRKVLLHAPKNGFFYVLDRVTGKLISAEKFGKVTWAAHIDLKTGRPVETPNARYESGDLLMWPTPLGAHSWQSQAFSPRTGLVYVPYMQLGMHMKRGDDPGQIGYNGMSIRPYMPDPLDGKGALIAWDPVQQKAAWKAQLDTLWNGGAMATAGDLVFEGAGDGYLSAYDARTGKTLWRFYAGMGINGAPMTYSVGGRQYVAVLAGYGGGAPAWGEAVDAGWSYKGQRRLLTFALDGKAVLPPSRARFTPVKPLDDPSLKLDPADVVAGEKLYMRCVLCHGVELQGVGGPAPDLRESPIAFNPDSLWGVVHDGALIQNGMPPFANLTREQVSQIYTYIRSGARKLASKQQAEAAARQ